MRNEKGQFVKGHSYGRPRKDKHIVKCEGCEKEFSVTLYDIKRGRGRFCAKSCFYAWKKKTIIKSGSHIICKCGKEFYVEPNLLKIGKGKFCSKDCSKKYMEYKGTFQNGHPDISNNTGRTRTAEQIEKYRQISLRIKSGSKTKGIPRARGINCKNYVRDRESLKTTQAKRIRQSTEYKEWRKAVYERDDYTCQICKVKGGRLNADHIKPFSLYPELILDVNNGRTLCHECHKKTDTYGINLIHQIRKQSRVLVTT